MPKPIKTKNTLGCINSGPVTGQVHVGACFGGWEWAKAFYRVQVYEGLLSQKEQLVRQAENGVTVSLVFAVLVQLIKSVRRPS